MYEWDDILIVGDSWCSERDNLSYWPNYLLFKLTNISEGIPRGKGYQGCAWWSVRKRLINELNTKSAKVVIIIHTEANRIPNDADTPITIRMALEPKSSKKIYTIIYNAAAEYYKHLYSDNFHHWAERRWFSELDNFLEKKQVEKVIHLYGVSKEKNQRYKFKHGVTVEHSLQPYIIVNTETVTYPNHMTYENNQKLAMFLFNLITNYPGHGFVHTEKKLF